MNDLNHWKPHEPNSPYIDKLRPIMTAVQDLQKPGPARPGSRVFTAVTHSNKMSRLAQSLATRGYRWLFDHPAHNRFTGRKFVEGLENQGLRVGPRRLTRIRGRYLLGVANRPLEPTC